MSTSSCSSAYEPSSSHWIACSALGSGSFGHVSLALNLDDGSLFAAKSLPSHASSPSSPELVALQNELHILRSLRSPFVVNFLGGDYSADNSVPRSLFLEYMDGGSLADVLQKCGGKLSEECQVRYYTRSILQGLQYLHHNGIVHCDIKSHNVLIGSTGVKIADFGAALRVGEASRMGNTLRGTPLWMAPEVAQGLEPTASSDVWSLGCTVVEMLQGRPPWGHIKSVAAALFKVGCSQENPPLPEFISAEARDFLLKCLQRDPDARWTAAQLLKHPFLCNLQAEEYGKVDGSSCGSQPSPRSTLEFWPSDTESDREDTESVMDYSVPMLCFEGLKVLASKGALEVAMSSDKWLTVKRGRRWCEERPLEPFLTKGTVKVVQQGGEVSFAEADFLKNRARQMKNVVVG